MKGLSVLLVVVLLLLANQLAVELRRAGALPEPTGSNQAVARQQSPRTAAAQYTYLKTAQSFLRQ